jgi:hypothetical protein
MITDTAQDAQIRRSILKSIEDMDLELLKRIAYECRCEEMGIAPDMTYMRETTEKHWDKLYTQLYKAYEECSKNYDETYQQKIGMILDHMTFNKPYMNWK